MGVLQRTPDQCCDQYGIGDHDSVEHLMDAIVEMHNDLHHPGRRCPSEDEDGACSIRTGKPARLTWTDHGPEYRRIR